jgi:hypothetical protein
LKQIIITKESISFRKRFSKRKQIGSQIANGGDGGDVSRHSSPSFAIYDFLTPALTATAAFCIIRAMKMSASKLFAAFGLAHTVSNSTQKKIISRRARGNVKLQLGKITTSREYENQKQKVLAYDFC